MTVTYFSNFLNHHQANVADELYEKLGTDYTFVELCPIYDWLLKGGYSDLSSRPYVLQAWRSPENYRKAEELALNADVALFGGPETLKLEVMRAKTGKLTFDVGERWLKRGLLNLASPRLLRYFWYYYTVFSKENVYKLCSSAYACGDHYKLYSFKNRCYKWGYFTKVEDFPFETSANFDVSSEETEVHLMWCARFLRWKHPELPVRLARRLKDKGYKFVFDMYGSGVELENVKRLASELEVTDVLRFQGNLPNDKILEQMRQHEIFLFTSDKNEGWGAVLNESMSNGCAVVASDEIGSVPFLVEDGVNGLVFKSEDLDSLETKVMSLLDNADCRRTIAANAMRTMRTLWSPQNAADNLLRLIDDLQAGRDTSIAVGPCSKALPI
ncbi:MAG: glycosyltransferase [Bacteroidales bacterium]|nr:glycosyltransferase [Bacteroidales bacterium]